MDLIALTIPGSVLAGSCFVSSVAQDVVICEDKLLEVAGRIHDRLLAGIDEVETAFGSAGALERDVNIVFFETACNFCFWSERGESTWNVDLGDKVVGGWYGLAACFNRAVQEGTPVHEAAWMAALTVNAAKKIFAGTGGTIPMIEQRVSNVVEAASYLLRKHNGHALNLLRENNFSAPRIAATIVRELPSFRDGARYGDKWVWILKRAQILPSDLSQLSAKYPEFGMTNCDQLTAFADYRLPQVLRHYGALEYSARLTALVDSGANLRSASRPEVEIRACTIQACERLKQHLPGRTSADIDLGLWLVGQDMRADPTLRPHHRTPGFFY